MNKALFIPGMIGWLAAAANAATLTAGANAATVIVVTNGPGVYYSAYGGMAFTDANNNYV